LENKVDDLSRAVSRLTLLHSHDAISLLCSSLSIPKLLFILRTSECSGNSALARLDLALREGLVSILNVEIDNDQWMQASLPVKLGGLGFRSDVTPALSAFLASAAGTRKLQDAVLPSTIRDHSEDTAVGASLREWSSLADGADAPLERTVHLHKALDWDGIVTTKIVAQLLVIA
jgi:hypothetical protein